MKKLAAFSVFGAAGLPGQAMAVDIVTREARVLDRIQPLPKLSAMR